MCFEGRCATLLARAVESKHADLGAEVEAERDVAQDLLVGRDDAPDLIH